MKKMLLIIGFTIVSILGKAQEQCAALINEQISIEVNKNTLTKSVYKELKIHNRQGEKYTTITIPYSKMYEVSKIEAYIKDANGKVVKQLKKQDITNKSYITDISFYDDYYAKQFVLQHNIYPYTITYSYQVVQNEFFYLDYWVPVIDTEIPTHKAHLTLSIPKDYKISYKNQHIQEPLIDTTENTITYHWTAAYTNIITAETFSPPLDSFLPAAVIVPHNFKYNQSGSLQNWIAYGNWQNELLANLNQLPNAEIDKIMQLTKGVEDTKEKIKLLYHYLQDETRYINITIETGGLKPYPAKYVAENKYGDCKALTNYFKSALEYLQIPSYYTKVYAGSPSKTIDLSFPSQQFNHVILYVPLRDEELWLDCTSDGAFNYLGTFTQNRDAFVVKSNHSFFAKTPSLLPTEVLETRKMDIDYTLNHAIVKSYSTLRGDAYESLLYVTQKYNNTEKSRIIESEIVAEGFDLVNYTINQLHRDSVKIELFYEATAKNIYKHYGADLIIKNIPFSIPQFEKPEARKLPLQFDYPIYKIDTLIYAVPAGYQLNKTQPSCHIVTKFGEYKYHISTNGKTIKVVKSILINAGNYTLPEYPDFYNFYAKALETENKTHLSLFK